jgi:DNA-binding GntR family transcriptional regulator
MNESAGLEARARRFGRPEMSAAIERPKPLTVEVGTYVRELIVSGRLRSGERVRLDVIAAELAVSVTPVREALQILESEGFVRHADRRGFRVVEVTSADIEHVFFVQAAVAGQLAALAAERLTGDDLAELDRLHAELVGATSDDDSERLESLNHQFHRVINRAAQAPKLLVFLRIAVRYAPRLFYSSIDGGPLPRCATTL